MKILAYLFFFLFITTFNWAVQLEGERDFANNRFYKCKKQTDIYFNEVLKMHR